MNDNVLRGQPKLIEVACLDERKEGSEIEIQYETITRRNEEGKSLSYPNRIKREMGPYMLDITAYGGGAPVSKKFKLSVDTNGQLRMNEL